MTQKNRRISESIEKEILLRLEERTGEHRNLSFFEFGKWSSVVARAAYFLGLNPLRVLIPAAIILAIFLALIFKERLIWLVSVFQGGF